MAHVSDLIASDIGEYLRQHETKSLLRFITCGSVDDGKSTLIGRLLYESKMLFEDQLAAVESDSRKWGTQGGEIDFATRRGPVIGHVGGDAVHDERAFVSEVVDPSGTWEITVDLAHPYLREHAEAREASALETKEARDLMERYGLTAEELRDILRGVTSPDEFVARRSLGREEVKNMDFLHVWSAYMVAGVVGSTGENELTELQLEFLRHDADTDKDVIDRYTAALAERGLHVTFTPHPTPGVDDLAEPPPFETTHSE